MQLNVTVKRLLKQIEPFELQPRTSRRHRSSSYRSPFETPSPPAAGMTKPSPEHLDMGEHLTVDAAILRLRRMGEAEASINYLM